MECDGSTGSVHQVGDHPHSKMLHHQTFERIFGTIHWTKMVYKKGTMMLIRLHISLHFSLITSHEGF